MVYNSIKQKVYRQVTRLFLCQVLIKLATKMNNDDFLSTNVNNFVRNSLKF